MTMSPKACKQDYDEFNTLSDLRKTSLNTHNNDSGGFPLLWSL